MSRISDKLLESLSLLVGLYILNVILFFLLRLLPIEDVKLYWAIAAGAPWFASLVFGVVIAWRSRDKGLIALPVGILAFVVPVYGSIFYMLTVLKSEIKND